MQTTVLAELFRGATVMAVGDPHQSIYGWRGASAANLAQFADAFDAKLRFSLSISWRNGEKILALRGPDHRGESRFRRPPLCAEAAGEVRRRHAGATRPDRPQGPARRQAVRRLEAAAGAGRFRHAQAAAPPPRRADRRRRPEGAARILGRDPQARRRWPDGARLDPLHGRSRTLPPHRLHRLRQDRRARHRARGHRRCRLVDHRRHRA